MPGATIGIVGGGQLGQMMALAAKEMGFRVGVLDPTDDSSAAQVANWQIVANYNDKKALERLAKSCDVLTYEFENVDVKALVTIQDKISIPQGTELLAITQDRLLEKAFLEEENIIIAPYATIVHPIKIQNAIKDIGYPCVLKTTRGGYDGKGQYVIASIADMAPAMNLLRLGTCVLEAWIPFVKEISIQIAGNGQGDYTLFPVVENIHRNNILHETIAPANVLDEVIEEAKRIALVIAESLNLAGVLCIEMFLTQEGGIYVNELAPRPHNSGHYTIEACSISQFTAHIRGIAGWPLPKIKQLSQAVMVNIIGDEYYDTQALIAKKANWNFHYYSKHEVKAKRKMGHLTILTENIFETLEEIYQSGVWD
jgi:5-(carboxyamino)imidazole ribonucleotide synthase